MAAIAPSPQATSAQQPTPERFFNAVGAYQQSEAIKAALELDIFSAIAQGHTSAPAIAAQCKAAERGVRTLCDFLTIHGFLEKQGREYSLAPDTAMFLDRSSRAYLGDAAQFLLNPHIREAGSRLTDAVRRGGTAIGQGTLVPENPDWVAFARCMMPMMYMPARIMAEELRKGGEVHKVLDIAAGHGIYGISVAQQNPNAHVYGSDWKNVLEVAQENAQRMGVADRYHLLPGSAFDVDFGTGYDLILVPNFLHHFDQPTCTGFLRKVRAALTPDGRAAIVDFVPNEDRVSPPMPASFSMMMLMTTPSGDAYTYAELERFAMEAGFRRVEMADQQLGMARLVIAHP
jgi:ubiquinone/menaquinone biosynthesis C-methylase UbiE